MLGFFHLLTPVRSDRLLQLRSRESHRPAKGPWTWLLGGGQVPGWWAREGGRGMLTDLVMFARAFRQTPTSLEACCFHQEMERTTHNASLLGLPYWKEWCMCQALSSTNISGYSAPSTHGSFPWHVVLSAALPPSLPTPAYKQRACTVSIPSHVGCGL